MISYFKFRTFFKDAKKCRLLLRTLDLPKSKQFSTICETAHLTSNFTSKSKTICVVQRNYSNNDPDSNKLPSLMEIPKITWPSLIKTIKNFILVTFIIKPYFDQEFSLADFINGSQKAVEVISSKLAEGDLKALDGLVASDIVDSLQKSVGFMSLSQREQVAITTDDIFFSFPYQIGIIFNEENEQKRFVEVTMVFHALKGLALMREKGEEPSLNMAMQPEYQNRISICNYRFIKEFTKGVKDDWTVNLLNHFKLIDEASE